MKKKCLAIGVILFFIGVTIAPSINFTVVKASNDNDLVEVTTQVCGINGFGKTTVKLTRQQYQNLEQYLVDFRARLNHTSTREEAVPIFKEAVVELDKYGLLPKGMRIEQVQRLVTCRYQNNRCIQLLGNYYQRNQLQIENESNSFCLISGQHSASIAILFVVNAFLVLLKAVGYNIDTLRIIQILRNAFFPFFSGTEIYFYPAYSDIYTNGVKGQKHWVGTIDGGYPFQYLHGYYGNFNLGVIGFTGIHLIILLPFAGDYIIGSAIGVKIKVSP